MPINRQLQRKTNFFFAINAVKRLDKTGELHYADKLRGEAKLENENGWIIRDDADSSFFSNWSAQNIVETDGQFFSRSVPPVLNRFSVANEPSQDQMILLMMGFSFVKKFVGPNVFVNPMNDNTGFDLLEESKAITRRMMQRLLAFKRNGENPFDDMDEAQPFIKDVENEMAFTPWLYKHGYSFGQPDFNWQCTGNNDDFIWLMAYPSSKLAEEITGDTYNTGYKVQWGGDDMNFITTVPWEALEGLFLNNIWVNNGEVTVSMLDLYTVLNSHANMALWFVVLNPGRQVFAEAIAAIAGKDINEVEAALSITVSGKHAGMNHRLMLQAICATQAMGPEGTMGVKAKADALPNPGSQLYTLINRIWNNSTVPSTEAGDYLSLLNAAPLCEGPFAFRDNEQELMLRGKKGPGGWDEASMWLEPGTRGVDANSFGNYNALDYMLLYNLVHIAMNEGLLPGQVPPEYDPEVTCPCFSDAMPENNNSISSPQLVANKDIIIPPNTFSSTGKIETFRYPFDYTQWGINLERYIVQDISMQGTGWLILEEDIKVCNNAKVEIIRWPSGAQARMQVGTDPTKPVILRFTEGSEFLVKNGGIIEVENNSKIIIEAGAVLKFYENGVINLKGPNSILEIQGRLDLQANATFQTIGEGYVVFDVKDPAFDAEGHNIQATATSKMVFETPVGTPKILKAVVKEGTYIYPSNDLELFKVENARIQTEANASIQLGCNFEINNSQIEGPGNGFTITWLDFDPVIKHNVFLGLNRSLTFIAPAGGSTFAIRPGRNVKIHFNEFYNCPGSIFLYEVAAHVAGNKFENSGHIMAGSPVPGIPIRAGLYRGPLKVELNAFKSSSAVEVAGSTYPFINFTGNVVTYPTMSLLRGGYAYTGIKAATTFKCNYFENQGEAIYAINRAHMNLSTTESSFIPLKTGALLTGGNNILKNNAKGLVIVDAEGSNDPFNTASYNLNMGQNSFETQVGWKSASLYVNRPFNIVQVNYQLNSNGDMEINGNHWFP